MKIKPDHGHFTGNYSLRRPSYTQYLKLWAKAVYPFINDPDDPLTFHRADGLLIRPLAVMDTDMGTVPRSVRVLISKDRYLDSYLIHDSGCVQGGFDVSSDGGETWGFVPASRLIVDQQLRDCIRAQQTEYDPDVRGDRWWSAINAKRRAATNLTTRNAIYRAVRAAGGGIWRRRFGDARDCK